jgi:hypothetical protein
MNHPSHLPAALAASQRHGAVTPDGRRASWNPADWSITLTNPRAQGSSILVMLARTA